MSKVAKVLTMSLILTVILIVSVTGVVLAAEDGKGEGTRNRGADCLCGEYPCVDGSSVTGVVLAADDDKGERTQNRGDECLCGECLCVDGSSDGLQLRTRTRYCDQ